MGFTLQNEDIERVNYSPRELEIFGLLPKNGSHINSSDIVDKYWKGKTDIPYYHRIVVMDGLRSLIRKVNHNKEDFMIKTGPSRGPHGLTAWIEKR